MSEVADYLALIPPYNASRPRFVSTVEALVGPLAAGQALLISMIRAFDLDHAVGAQLDAVGVRIGQPRQISVPLAGYFTLDEAGLGFDEGYWQGRFDPDTGVTSLDDDSYRLLLRARSLANAWDGTIGSAEAIYRVLFAGSGYAVTIQDNQDMTMTVFVTGSAPDPRARALIEGGYLDLTPAGVAVTDYVFEA